MALTESRANHTSSKAKPWYWHNKNRKKNSELDCGRNVTKDKGD